MANLRNGPSRVRPFKDEARHPLSAVAAAMKDVVRIEPTVRDAGLIGYECPNCVYVTSVLLEPQPKGSRG
jgi:hypothetical protein